MERPSPCPPDALAWTGQRHIWGTTDWAQDYGHRAAVESSNAAIKIHRAHLDRGHTRVFGTLKNALLIAFTLALGSSVKYPLWGTPTKVAGQAEATGVGGLPVRK